MAIEFILSLLGAYLLGSVPAAYLATKWSRGIDIRKHGTGNVGAANVLSVAPKWLAIPVAFFDIGKGALTVWIAQLLGLGAAEQVTVGIVTVIGHNWPLFLRFKGGRGIFTTLGVVAMLSFWLGMIILVIGYMLAPIRQIALGVFLALVSLPIFSWFLSQPLGIEDRLVITVGFGVLSLILLSKRLVTPRTQLSESVSPGELFINRLLFDRDIRDRKAWINRRPVKQQGKG
ncbi:glycerol-3-phosphate acyltransferase [Chloroflexota bacterium]